MGPQDAVRAIWGRNCRKASVIEIVVYNDHESWTLVNEGGTAEIFPFVPLHNAGGMKGFFICGRSGKDFLRGKMHGSSKRCIKFNLYKSEGRSVSLADDFHTDVGNRYAAPLGFSIGCRLYSELDDCDLCSGDIADKAILSAMPGDLYGGSAYGSIYFEVRVSVW